MYTVTRDKTTKLCDDIPWNRWTDCQSFMSRFLPDTAIMITDSNHPKRGARLFIPASGMGEKQDGCKENLTNDAVAGPILHWGNKGDCLHAQWSLPGQILLTVEIYNSLKGVPFTKKKMPLCPCPFKIEAFWPGPNSMALLTSELCAYDHNSLLTCKRLISVLAF